MKKGELKEGYIAKWNEYPEHEIKIRVARPHVLAPSAILLNSYMNAKANFLIYGEGTPPKHVTDQEARELAWKASHYEERFRAQILSNNRALFLLGYIMGLVDSGQTVRLICYEKEPPCHRFVLIKMIEEMMNCMEVKKRED